MAFYDAIQGLFGLKSKAKRGYFYFFFCKKALEQSTINTYEDTKRGKLTLYNITQFCDGHICIFGNQKLRKIWLSNDLRTKCAYK